MKKYFLLYTTIVISLTACVKENSDVFIPNPTLAGVDTVWQAVVTDNAAANVMMQEFAKPALVDSFDATLGREILFGDSLQVTFAPLSCVSNTGSPLSGKLKLELHYLKSKGDMIRFNRPTTSGNRLLESGGAFQVKVSQNGQPVSLASGAYFRLKFREQNPRTYMKVFYGEQSTTNTPTGPITNFTWALSQDTTLNSVGVVPFGIQGTTNLAYQMLATRFNWINCDAFTDTTQPRTKVTVLLPITYTNVNTAVYMVFNNQRTVLRLNGEAATRTFSTINIPIGSNVSIISIAKIANNFYADVKEAAITNGHTISLSPQLKTKAQIDALLNGL
jgi:hypothetical protein